MTLGEYRVGLSFNPSNDPTVDRLKQAAANFIDIVDNMATSAMMTDEVARLKAIAMTHIEDAAMWSVKAATKSAP